MLNRQTEKKAVIKKTIFDLVINFLLIKKVDILNSFHRKAKTKLQKLINFH